MNDNANLNWPSCQTAPQLAADLLEFRKLCSAIANKDAIQACLSALQEQTKPPVL